jgi:hypothetical protein
MSAPEVARELLDLCGPPDQWRGDDDDDDFGYVQRAATEVYEGGADDDEPDDNFAVPSLHRLPSPSARISSSRHSSARISRPRTEAARLQGVVELTSIINIIDLENQHREVMGDKPLVDLDLGPRLDDRPRLLDSRLAAVHPGPPPLPRSRPPWQPPPPPPPSRQVQQPAVPSDLIPTQPQPRGPSQPMEVPRFPAPVRRGSQPRKKSLIRSWMVIVAIVVAAAVAGMVVAMSGPDVAVQHGK